MDPDEICDAIDRLWETFLQTRAIFPYMDERVIGATACRTAPFYQNRGHKITFNYSQPLTADDIELANRVGRWLNESLVVRAIAVLEYHGVVSNSVRIDTSLDGHDDVDILRRLR